VRAAFLEHFEKMFAECSQKMQEKEKTSHRFCIVLLKTGLSVSKILVWNVP